VLLELALVFPIFLMLILALLEATQLCMITQALSTAAREGARVAVINGNTNSDVTTRINTILTSAGLTDVNTVLSPTDCTSAHITSSPNTVTVTLTYTFTSGWAGTSLYFNGAQLTGTAAMSSERP
jgi:Flp pilus assembly protein TadG